MEKAKVAHMMTVNWNMEKLLMDKMNGLKNLGYDIELISSGGEYVNKIRQEGYVYHTVHISREINLLQDFKSILRLYKIFKETKYDIVHTHTAKAGFVGRISAKLANVPIIIHTAHGLPFYEGQSKFQFSYYRLLEKFAGFACDYVFSQNKQDFNKIIEYNIKPKEKVYFEGNGVNIERLESTFNNTDAESKRSELNIEKSSFIIGYFARYEEVKGHHTFIDALEKLTNEYPNIICLMAGKGELEEQISEIIIKKKMQKNVRMLGFRDDIIELLKIVDLMVLASEKEGVPRIIMESMALGVPVVGTNVLGTRELIENQKSGILVEYKNVEDTYRGIKLMYERSDLRKLYSYNAKNRILKQFNEDLVVNNIHEKYQEILKYKRLNS